MSLVVRHGRRAAAPWSPPPLAQPGAQTPFQNPGEKTTPKIRAEADRRVKSKKCPQSVKTNGKNPRFRAPSSSSAPSDGSLTPPHRQRAGVSDTICSDRAAKSAGKTKNIACAGTGTGTSTVPQSMLRKQSQGSPRARTAALPSIPWERGWVQPRE